MMNISAVPSEVIASYVHYTVKTGNTSHINDLTIADDGRVFISTVVKSDSEGGFDIVPLFITGDLHPTIMDTLTEDLKKVEEFMASEVIRLSDEEEELRKELYND